MQMDKFTIKAQEAVGQAQQLAQQKDHPEITPLHLLAALVGETDGVVRRCFRKLAPTWGKSNP